MNSDVKDVVKKVLHQYPSARNSDKLLIIHCMKKYGAINNSLDFNSKEFMSMPSFATISRVRRDVQNNDKMYLPIEEVSSTRQAKNEEFRNYYGTV